MEGFNIWQLLGGVTAFLFAMSLISSSLKSMAGRSFKKFLQKQTASTFKGLLSGTIVTAVLQSSSVVVLMVLSFVGAGIIPLRNALAVVLGSNLGTTFNSWIVAYVGFKTNVQSLAFPFLALALVRFIFFNKNETAKSITDFMIGIALLFIGIGWMQEGNSGLTDYFQAGGFPEKATYWFVLAGFIITVMLQSSGATFALTLASVHAGVMPLLPAAAMILGAEMGTTIKIFLGSIGGTQDQKRMALANFMMNLVTSIIVAIFLQFFFGIVTDWLKVKDPYMSLAFFQSIVNLLTILLFYPFVRQVAHITEKIFKTSEGEIDLKFIRKQSVGMPAGKLQLAEEEILHLLRHVMDYNQNLVSPPKKHVARNRKEFIDRILKPVSMAEQYRYLKDLHGEILDYLVEMNRDGLTPEENERCAVLLDASRYIMVGAKDIKDIVHNLADLKSTANDTLFEMHNKIELSEQHFYEFLKSVFSTENSEMLTADKLEEMQKANKNWQKKLNKEIYALIDEDKIDNRDASTLLNVVRSVYSSHKATLNALALIFNHPQNHLQVPLT